MRKQSEHKRMQNKCKHCETRIPINLRTIDISKLKAFVENFPQGSPLPVVFVGER
jgi:hypothetical protein